MKSVTRSPSYWDVESLSVQLVYVSGYVREIWLCICYVSMIDYLCCESKCKWLKVLEKKYYHTRGMDFKVEYEKVMCHKMKMHEWFCLRLWSLYVLYCMTRRCCRYTCLRVKLIFEELSWKTTTICCKRNYYLGFSWFENFYLSICFMIIVENTS